MELVVSFANRPHLLQMGERTDEPAGLCSSTSPQPHATPASARTSEWPHVAHSAISPRRASCTPRCSGQGDTATFLLRFLRQFDGFSIQAPQGADWTITPDMRCANARMDEVWLDFPELSHAREPTH
jgi:hypothetical protein